MAPKDDYPAAAAKHLRDAEILHAATRWDGTAYLAGYVVECALKEIARLEGKLKHFHLNKLPPQILALVAAPGPRTARYVRDPAIAPLLGRVQATWSPDMRYAAPFVTDSEADAALADAKTAYKKVIQQMQIDLGSRK